jgi:superfamily II DNA helicase RecQ
MRYEFFRISAVDPVEETAELNAFLSSNRITTVDRQFVADAANSFWSFCVGYEGRRSITEKPTSRKTVDYREILSPQEFAVFARLRELRKTLAAEEGVPPYAIFNNEQLAAIARLEAVTKTSLASIEGIGAKRIERYADAVLSFLGLSND